MEKTENYRKILDSLITSRGKWESYAKECEEFYYSNVEGTHTQFSKKQVDTIKNDYDILVSINILFPVMEQMIAFLVGDPSMRVLPVGNADKNIAYQLQALWSGVWYKCSGPTKMRLMLLDSLITGSGYLMVEPTSYYDHNIFGVSINHLPWRYVYTDPNSHKFDLTDAEFMLISKTMSSNKVAKIYGIAQQDLLNMGWINTLSSGPDDSFTEVTTKPIVMNDLYIKEMIKDTSWLLRSGKLEKYTITNKLKRAMFNNDPGMLIEPGVYINRKVLLGNNNILWQGWLPTQEYPIFHFPAIYEPVSVAEDTGSVTYGMVHMIKDSQKAINKTLANIILNAQLHGHAKMLLPEGSADPQEVYDWASDPRRPLKYRVDPNEPTIKPERIQPAQLSNAHYTLFQELIKLVEYVTGIYSVMQGNPQDAPNTFGGTQSLQVYGTQRIKMRASIMDTVLSKLCHTTLNYLMFYTDPQTIFRYVDSKSNQVQDPATGQMQQQQGETNEPWRELKLTGNPTINEYDVVAMPNPSTPTTRMLASMLLGTISGQTRDPEIANILTQYSLKLLDIPEADEILQKMDIIGRMKSQLEQMQQGLEQTGKQIDTLTKENDSLKKESIAKDVKFAIQAKVNEVDKELSETTHETDKDSALIINDLQNKVDSKIKEIDDEEQTTIQ